MSIEIKLFLYKDKEKVHVRYEHSNLRNAPEEELIELCKCFSPEFMSELIKHLKVANNNFKGRIN
jgi:hypothetical protein